MAEVKKTTKVVTGIEKGYYSVIGADGSYGAVKELNSLGMIEFGIVPSESTTSLFVGNKEALVEEALGGIEASLTVPGMDTDVICEVLGKKKATGGGYIDSANDVKPYIAIMMEKTLSEGVKQYITLYKGKLNLPEEKAKTKEGSVEYQTQTLTGKFIPLENGMWKHSVRTDDTDYDATAHATSWGKTVVVAQAKPVTP